MAGSLVFDGECGFCTRSRNILVRLDRRRRIRMVPFQRAGVAEAAGVSREELARAVFWEGDDGGRYWGAEAINAALSAALGNSLLLWLYRLPGVRRLEDVVYRWVAENRYRLPGVTPWCRSHPDDCLTDFHAGQDAGSRVLGRPHMSKAISRMPLSVQGAALHTAFALPPPLRRLIAGPPIRRDGLELSLDAQLLLRMVELADLPLTSSTVEGSRARMETGRTLLGGPIVSGIRTRNLNLPVAEGTIPGRLYEPVGLPDGSPLLVYFHGGGWVIGTLDTHDGTCRYLARQANVRVLSVGYRLAPEYPFPAAADDATAAFRFAASNAESLGVDPSAIAVGGDSAGGNLAAVVCLDALRGGGPRPVFQLLFYPATDPSVRRRSRDLFADGFFLTDDDMTWFVDHYCPDPAARTDSRIAVLLADDLRGLPPAYIATAGFDPLRDEGNAFADRLREAGVPVVKRQHDDLIHGFANFISLGSRFREAVSEAAGALRTGLALRSRANVVDIFRPTA